MNTGNAQPNESDVLLQYLRENSSPLDNGIRLVGSPRSSTSGPRQAIIIVNIIHKRVGIHGFVYGFRRLENPELGTYIEKLHRDQVRGRDPYLLGAPLNVLKNTYGSHNRDGPILNDKGYELSSFVAIQNFQGKTEQEVRQLAKYFATAIKIHIEKDPNCQNQEIVVSEDNILYNEDSVFMDFIGERNAVNLYRTILPVDSTPGYSQFYLDNARSFFHEHSLSPQSVSLIKSDDTFLAPDPAQAQEAENAQEHGDDDAAPAAES